ncbi:ABC transporter permease [Desulfosporosinus nitroreducens]|uniref:ABC transporter permease n=1 Tax=Desulfosporosinus nitroreducens TaxID=2018668 RepID=A0ABT8QQW6_9FIRM|nr:ABC transporter permease [Desulfosporosinus nitroreducens]MCO1603034.1 ABC transporter permease [Desulfosporosinus nitroreducens]MDO0823736.1 ABC transporter permease [Desulfosporosinus nitroreducens]
MARYLFGRIVSALLVVWLVVTLTFFLMHAIPGGPFSSEKILPPAIMENINQRYHLNDPLANQYLDYLKNIAHFNFGPTFRYEGRTVNDLFREGLPKTIALGLVATVLALVGGTMMGIIAALKQNKAPDYIATFLATIGVSVPSFVLATFLQYFVGFKTHWFPPIGWGEAKNLVLPALALSAYPIAQITRLTRSSMLDVLNQDYIRTAKSKGLPGYIIVLRHALRNALIPVVTFMGPFFAYILTGNFVVEYVFNIPGIGQFFVTSIGNRDYPVIMGTTILFATLLVTFNLLVDIAYTVVDPRIKLTGRKGA